MHLPMPLDLTRRASTSAVKHASHFNKSKPATTSWQHLVHSCTSYMSALEFMRLVM